MAVDNIREGMQSLEVTLRTGEKPGGFFHPYVVGVLSTWSVAPTR